MANVSPRRRPWTAAPQLPRLEQASSSQLEGISHMLQEMSSYLPLGLSSTSTASFSPATSYTATLPSTTTSTSASSQQKRPNSSAGQNQKESESNHGLPTASTLSSSSSIASTSSLASLAYNGVSGTTVDKNEKDRHPCSVPYSSESASDPSSLRLLFLTFDTVTLPSQGQINLLLIGFTRGFQIWSITEAEHMRELCSLSEEGLCVHALKILQPPESQGLTDAFVDHRPLVVASTSSNEDATSMSSGICIPNRLKIYSLKTCEMVHPAITLSSEITSIRSNSNILAVGTRTKILGFYSHSLAPAFSIPTLCSSSMAVFALGPRWLAYSTSSAPQETNDFSSFPDEAGTNLDGLVTSDSHSDPSVSLFSNASTSATNTTSTLNSAVTGTKLTSDRLTGNGLGKDPALDSDFDEPEDLVGSSSTLASSWVDPKVVNAARVVAKDIASGLYFLGDLGYKKVMNHVLQQPSDDQVEIDFKDDGNTSEARSILRGSSFTSSQCEAENNSPGYVVVVDMLNLAVIAHFRAHGRSVAQISFSADGTLLATSSVEGHHFHVYQIAPEFMTHRAGVRSRHNMNVNSNEVNTESHESSNYKEASCVAAASRSQNDDSDSHPSSHLTGNDVLENLIGDKATDDLSNENYHPDEENESETDPLHSSSTVALNTNINSTSYKVLYQLKRGITSAVVESMMFSPDGRWLAVTTSRGTTHLFAINPFGGPVTARGHVSASISNEIATSVGRGLLDFGLFGAYSQFAKPLKAVSLNAAARIRPHPAHSQLQQQLAQILKQQQQQQQQQQRSNQQSQLSLGDDFPDDDDDIRVASKESSPKPTSRVAGGRSSLAAKKSNASSASISFASSAKNAAAAAVAAANMAKSVVQSFAPVLPDAATGSSALTTLSRARIPSSAVMFLRPKLGAANIFGGMLMLIGNAAGVVTLYRITPRTASPSERRHDMHDLNVSFEAVSEWNFKRADAWTTLPGGDVLDRRREPIVKTGLEMPGVDEKHSPSRWLSEVEITTCAPADRPIWMGPQFSFKTILNIKKDSPLIEDDEGLMTTPVTIRHEEPVPYKEGETKSPSVKVVSENEIKERISNAIQSHLDPPIRPLVPHDLDLSFEDAYCVPLTIAADTATQIDSDKEEEDSSPSGQVRHSDQARNATNWTRSTFFGMSETPAFAADVIASKLSSSLPLSIFSTSPSQALGYAANTLSPAFNNSSAHAAAVDASYRRSFSSAFQIGSLFGTNNNSSSIGNAQSSPTGEALNSSRKLITDTSLNYEYTDHDDVSVISNAKKAHSKSELEDQDDEERFISEYEIYDDSELPRHSEAPMNDVDHELHKKMKSHGDVDFDNDDEYDSDQSDLDFTITESSDQPHQRSIMKDGTTFSRIVDIHSPVNKASLPLSSSKLQRASVMEANAPPSLSATLAQDLDFLTVESEDFFGSGFLASGPPFKGTKESTAPLPKEDQKSLQPIQPGHSHSLNASSSSPPTTTSQDHHDDDNVAIDLIQTEKMKANSDRDGGSPLPTFTQQAQHEAMLVDLSDALQSSSTSSFSSISKSSQFDTIVSNGHQRTQSSAAAAAAATTAAWDSLIDASFGDTQDMSAHLVPPKPLSPIRGTPIVNANSQTNVNGSERKANCGSTSNHLVTDAELQMIMGDHVQQHDHNEDSLSSALADCIDQNECPWEGDE